MKTREKSGKRRRRGATVGEYLLLGALFLLFSVASLRLPSRILDWQDGKMVGRRVILDSQEVVVTAQEDMSLLEKMRLAESGNINSMYMENGRHYTRESVGDKAAEELRKLKELGILTDCELDRMELEAPEAEFVLDVKDGERSMILWHGYARTDQWGFSWQMDDETGKFLSVSQYGYTNASDDDIQGTDGATQTVGNEIYDAGGGAYPGFPDPDGTRVKTESAKQEPLEVTLADLTERAEKWGEYLGIQMTESGVTVGDIVGYQAEGYDLIEERVKALMDKDYSRTEAYYMVLAEMGLPEYAYETQTIYAVYMDEEGEEGVVYFQKRKNNFSLVGAVN